MLDELPRPLTVVLSRYRLCIIKESSIGPCQLELIMLGGAKPCLLEEGLAGGGGSDFDD